MKPTVCSPVSCIEPQFHRAFEVFFASGQDAPGFAAHVLAHALREEEVINAAEELAQALKHDGHIQLSRLLLDVLPAFESSAGRGSSSWQPALDIGCLGQAIAKVRRHLHRQAPHLVNCPNCGQEVRFMRNEPMANCSGCGYLITADGEAVWID